MPPELGPEGAAVEAALAAWRRKAANVLLGAAAALHLPLVALVALGYGPPMGPVVRTAAITGYLVILAAALLWRAVSTERERTMFCTTKRLALAATLVLAGMLPAMMQAGMTIAVSDTLDQATQTETWTDLWTIGGGNRPEMAQIVTAGQYGFLDRVRLYLDSVYLDGPDARVRVEIQTVSGGLPSGTVIGSGTIPGSALVPYGAPGWVNATISGTVSLTVTPGAQYAIVLSSGGSIIRWYSSGDVYSRGYMLLKGAGGWTSWFGDAMFQAYVIPDTVDQSHSQAGYYRQLSGTPVGQTFTVGQYAILDRISVYLGNSSNSPAPIAVALRTVTGDGLPTATQVASGTIPADAIPRPGLRGWATASISPLLVSPGTKYALLLSTSVSGPGWVLGSDVYSGGSLVLRNGTSWTASPYDAAFETRVIPPILDQQLPLADRNYGSICGHSMIARNCLQGYIAGWSGILPQVSLGLTDSDMTYADTVTASVEEHSSGTVVGSGTVPTAALPRCCSPNWVDFILQGVSTSSVQVIAGTQYDIHVTVSEGDFLWWGPVPGYSQMAQKTFILPVTTIATSPPSQSRPPGITPCDNGVCPEASGGFIPADLTDGVTSHFQFRERPNGTIQGTLTFTDPSPGGLTLHGCTTESAACRLTVTTFACADQQTMTVAGTYTPMGEAAGNYRLTLSGARRGIGTFTLNAGGYGYTLTQDGIVDVTCPPVATWAAATGQR